MARVQLDATGLEFEEGGSTIWVQGVSGTLLRVKCSGRISVKLCDAPGAHADVFVDGDIHFCVAPRSEQALCGSELSSALRNLEGVLNCAENTVKSLCAALEEPL